MEPPSLTALVAEELALPVDARVSAMAAAIAARHPTARAVLFYGSCLRETQLDGLMLDFYLIVGDYDQAFDKAWLATANRLLPPNVFPFEHDGLIAKYAVLSEADFHRLNGEEADNVSVWARFAQPSRLVWAADVAARAAAVDAVAQAAPTLLELTIPTLPAEPGVSTPGLWRRGFALTYASELRAERKNRPGSVVDADPARYERFGNAALAAIARRHGVGPNGEVPNSLGAAAARRRWATLRRRGKALTLARLLKATFTYAGGIDYLAWKISRHSGHAIEIKPWQRRHPIVGALTLLPRLLARGAIR